MLDRSPQGEARKQNPGIAADVLHCVTLQIEVPDQRCSASRCIASDTTYASSLRGAKGRSHPERIREISLDRFAASLCSQ
jgi:hypothetical protein